MVSQEQLLKNIAREGGAVIMHSFSTIAVFPGGEMKVIRATMYPAKEDKYAPKKQIAQKKLAQKRMPEFTVESGEVQL